MSKLLRVIRSIFGGYFRAARKAEKQASDLERELVQSLADLEATPESERWYNNC